MPAFDDTFYTLGRWQPFSHHHFTVVDYFAEEYGADEVYIGILRTPDGSRSTYNPFTDEEVEEMIETAYDTEYDVPYDVEPFVFHDNPLTHRREIADHIGEDATFFTREESWLWTAKVLEAVERYGPYEQRDLDYVKRDRNHELLVPLADRHGVEITESATEIRDSIAAADDEWKRYVADGVVDLIEHEYDEAVATLEEGERNCSGKYQVLDRARERVSRLAGGRR